MADENLIRELRYQWEDLRDESKIRKEKLRKKALRKVDEEMEEFDKAWKLEFGQEMFANKLELFEMRKVIRNNTASALREYTGLEPQKAGRPRKNENAEEKAVYEFSEIIDYALENPGEFGEYWVEIIAGFDGVNVDALYFMGPSDEKTQEDRIIPRRVQDEGRYPWGELNRWSREGYEARGVSPGGLFSGDEW